MAQALSNRISGSSLVEIISNGVASLHAAHARRAIYRRTLAELRALSDRDLADMGINRFDIEDLAYEAAYGK